MHALVSGASGRLRNGPRVAPSAERMSQHTSPSRARAWVGAGVARREAPALLSGEARFIDDLAPLPGLKHAAILRSPHPHAEIRSISAARAQALPGVVGVVTGRELASDVRPLASV